MNKWALRLAGLGSLILGGVLFVVAVKHITAEWPQIFVGLLSVFLASVGFGVLIMPLESPDSPSTKNGSPKA